ncbi:BAG domain [Dillenia turbinata]|uniref:BAG domain n=1 Tax=Dillenia turbinata TaxID=194707 RepID=A0AAN8VJ90_9MAGN
MMESPFFRTSHWSTPSRRSIPVHQQPATKSPAPARKVITIPVHYVSSDSEKGRIESSALKIQKVFRGFMVRKSMKKIASIKAEVEEIEMRISKAENVDLIRRDSKEKLKLNEMLMSLLFKLDSVRGVDSGIRFCRKGVIKKAIALQEKLDSIDAADQMVETGDQSIEANDLVDSGDPIVEEAQTLETQEQSSDDSICADNAANQSAKMQIQARDFIDQTLDVDQTQQTLEFEAADETLEEEDPERSKSSEELQIQDENGENRGAMCSMSECEEDKQSQIEGEEAERASGKQEGEQMIEKNVKSEEAERRVGEENKRNSELLEKMIEDNEKMIGLMAELYERNEMQTLLLSSLTQRVEQLERDFRCERLRRKKKRHSTGSVDGVDASLKLKKCGKR